MSVKYEIEHWYSDTAPRATSYIVRKRSNAARDALYATIYDMIRGNAMLDTEAGWRLVKQFDECNTNAPPHGHYRHETFRLLDERVEFRATRI